MKRDFSGATRKKAGRVFASQPIGKEKDRHYTWQAIDEPILSAQINATDSLMSAYTERIRILLYTEITSPVADSLQSLDRPNFAYPPAARASDFWPAPGWLV
jgi:hypothetical protein